MCPPVPERLRASARQHADLPSTDAERARLAGDAMLADLHKGRALAEMIALYERCRAGG